VRKQDARVTPDATLAQLRPFRIPCCRLRIHQFGIAIQYRVPEVITGITLRRTTEVAEGKEGCVRSWVVRVAPGSAHSEFEFAFRVLSS